MLLTVKLDSTISNIELYNTARFMLDKIYEFYSDYYCKSYDIENYIKKNYLESMFDNLINLLNSIDYEINTNELLVITNIIYRLKGLRESLEYLFITVLKAKFELTYNYIDFIFEVTIDNLLIKNLTQFNIYIKKLINELYYTKDIKIKIKDIILNINIYKNLSYGISQTYFNDFRIVKQ